MSSVLRQVSRGLHVGITAANIVGAAAVFVFLELSLVGPTAAPGTGSVWIDGVVFLGSLVVGSAAGIFFGNRLAAPMKQWLREERPPTDEERHATLTQPWRHAVMVFGIWLAGAVLYPIGAVAFFDNDALHGVRIGDAIVFGGLSNAALTYLLVERTLRPVFALALADHVPDRPVTLGIRPRLLLAWALGSGVPLFGLAVTPSVIETPDWELAISTLGVLGLLAGAVMTWIAAHSVSQPLEELRHGLRRVGRSDFAARVTVDDGGEVGLLQAGFNQMVQGLEERERLQDLFGRHVGEQVARLALEHGVDLGGEQMEASVLFVDLVGSTALAQDRAPSEVVEHLNRFFATVVRIVGEEGGYVSRFEGDGAVCLFGAPVALNDHAGRALRAGRRLAAALRSAGFPAGVGVSSGVVVAGNVGTVERFEYTVIGDPVNEAARLTEAAKGTDAGVLASEDAVSRADVEALQWAAGEEVLLRGRSRPTRTYHPSESVAAEL